MKKFLKTDEWNIIEEGFHADKLRASESIFSLGNGRFGQRGNFEETYSSDSLQGSYVAGISFRPYKSGMVEKRISTFLFAYSERSRLEWNLFKADR